MSVRGGSLGGAGDLISTPLGGETGGAWSDLAPHPVRRWIARLFDAYATTAAIFVLLAFPWTLLGRSEARFAPAGLLLAVYIVPPVRGVATAVLNACLLGRYSTTPGKWLCGVRIVRKDGGPLTFGVAVKRELDALAAGCALYIPLLGLGAMGFNFFDLRRHGAASWDRDRDLVAVQRPNSAGQFAVALASLVVALACAILMVALAAGALKASGR